MNGRGLTLIEVLAATVLLALMAGACVPVIQSSLRSVDSSTAPVTMFDLAQAVKAIIDDESVLVTLGSSDADSLELAWPRDVHIERLDGPRPVIKATIHNAPLTDAADAERKELSLRGRWIRFSIGEMCVHRWFPLDADEDARS